MKITTKIGLDLSQQNRLVRTKAVQNDANSREIEIHLYSDGVAWPVPESVTPAFGYCRPDGAKGIYEQLSNGAAALTASENVVTAVIAPQVLTVAGIVDAVIILRDTSANQLSTFPFQISVEKNPAAGVAELEEPDTEAIIPSGEITITENGSYNVTPYASANVALPEAELATPSITVDANGLITAEVDQEAGVVSAGTSTATKQLPTQAAKTVTPGTANTTAVAAGKYTTGDIVVKGDTNLIPGNIKSGVSIFGVAGDYSADDTSTDEEGGTTPSGEISITENGSYDVTNYATAKVELPEVEQATPSITVDANGLITAEVDQEAGLVEAGTKSATKQLPTQAAQTITPGTSDQTIDSGKYLTGVQTIKGDSNLVASNIKKGVSIFGVGGTYVGSSDSGNSEICEVHPITIAEVQNNTTVSLLEGNAFLAEHSADEGLLVALISLDNLSNVYHRIGAIYHGNRPTMTYNGSTGYGAYTFVNQNTYTTVLSNGAVTVPINNADTYSAARLAVNDSGDLSCYLPSDKYLAAGSYVVVLVLASA